ncbi:MULTISPECIES: DUF305 domain-containing protein [unclassified Nocardia]|uniref:DUF305 domain-containing protein n=1 Tax=unclassified Nocardia TaxID=2637762 RepID=UPI001CE3CC0F|nr:MULTISPECIES: DUF305 domain-containing protein [unclassified Nocardia]
MDEPETGAVRGQRTALFVLGAIGLLLIGFAVGVLARQPLDRPATPAPNSVDIGFAQDMAAHHAQAVEMAGIALVGSTDNDVRRLAYDIMTSQESQIGRMQGWLQTWGQPEQGVNGHMGWMTEQPTHDHTGGNHGMTGPVTIMPGMASDNELAALRKATGAQLDTMFLQLMLRHHQGGQPMMHYAAQYAATTEIRTLADSMAQAQQSEAELIATMLTARNAKPLPN